MKKILILLVTLFLFSCVTGNNYKRADMLVRYPATGEIAKVYRDGIHKEQYYIMDYKDFKKLFDIEKEQRTEDRMNDILDMLDELLKED